MGSTECIIYENAVAQISQFFCISFACSIAVFEFGLLTPVTGILKEQYLSVL